MRGSRYEWAELLLKDSIRDSGTNNNNNKLNLTFKCSSNVDTVADMTSMITRFIHKTISNTE